MGETIVTINQWMLICTIVFAFFFMLTVVKKKHVPKKYRLFYLYPAASFILIFILWGVLLDYIPRNIFEVANRYSLIYQQVFLSVFMISELQDKVLIKVSKVLFLLFLIGLCTSIIVSNLFVYIEVVISYFGLFLISSLYFVDKIINIPEEKLSNIPSFWIVIGVFLNMVISIPSMLVHWYVESFLPDITWVLFVIATISAVAMYVFFIKGIICAKKQIA